MDDTPDRRTAATPSADFVRALVVLQEAGHSAGSTVTCSGPFGR